MQTFVCCRWQHWELPLVGGNIRFTPTQMLGSILGGALRTRLVALGHRRLLWGARGSPRVVVLEADLVLVVVRHGALDRRAREHVAVAAASRTCDFVAAVLKSRPGDPALQYGEEWALLGTSNSQCPKGIRI